MIHYTEFGRNCKVFHPDWRKREIEAGSLCPFCMSDFPYLEGKEPSRVLVYTGKAADLSGNQRGSRSFESYMMEKTWVWYLRKNLVLFGP